MFSVHVLFSFMGFSGVFGSLIDVISGFWTGHVYGSACFFLWLYIMSTGME